VSVDSELPSIGLSFVESLTIRSSDNNRSRTTIINLAGDLINDFINFFISSSTSASKFNYLSSQYKACYPIQITPVTFLVVLNIN
jgi:hypothetical protein